MTSTVQADSRRQTNPRRFQRETRGRWSGVWLPGRAPQEMSRFTPVGTKPWGSRESPLPALVRVLGPQSPHS